MNLFLESQVPALLISLAIGGTCVAMFMQSRRPVFLLGLIAAVALLIGGIALEAAVVTDREAVEQVFYDGADAMESGDVARLDQLISPSADYLRATMHAYLRGHNFNSVSVTVESVEITPSSSPPRARAQVFGKLYHQSARSNDSGQNPALPQGGGLRGEGDLVAGRVDFWLIKEDGAWKIDGFDSPNGPR